MKRKRIDTDRDFTFSRSERRVIRTALLRHKSKTNSVIQQAIADDLRARLKEN